MKNLLKVISFCLWINNFVGLATALKYTQTLYTSTTYPTHLDRRSPDNGDINKTHLYTHKLGTSKQSILKRRLQINPLKVLISERHQSLQQIKQLKYSGYRNRKSRSTFCTLPSFTHSRVQHNFFVDCRFNLQSKNL